MKLKRSNDHSIGCPASGVHGGGDRGFRIRECWLGEGAFEMTLSKDFSASRAHFPPAGAVEEVASLGVPRSSGGFQVFIEMYRQKGGYAAYLSR